MKLRPLENLAYQVFQRVFGTMPRTHEMMYCIAASSPKCWNLKILTWIYESIGNELPELAIQPKVGIIGQCVIVKYRIVWHSRIQWHLFIQIKQSFYERMLGCSHDDGCRDGTFVHITQYQVGLEELLGKRFLDLYICI